MPVAHPLQVAYSTDPYLHDFHLVTGEPGAVVPWNVTGTTWSARVLDDEYGALLPSITATVAVLDGAAGIVRLTITQAKVAELLGTESSRTVWVRIRNDTIEQTVLSVPVEFRP